MINPLLAPPKKRGCVCFLIPPQKTISLMSSCAPYGRFHHVCIYALLLRNLVYHDIKRWEKTKNNKKEKCQEYANSMRKKSVDHSFILLLS